MAVVIVLAAWATGGDLAKALLVAAGFFVLATAWGWRWWRARLREHAAREEQKARARP